MQEALRYALLDEPVQMAPITACMFFACWVLSWTINAKVFALAPELLDPDEPSGFIGQLTVDLITALPAVASAMSLIQIAAAKDNPEGLGFNSLSWAAGLLVVGMGATLLGRVGRGAQQASPTLVATLRIFAAFWVLVFSCIVIWGGTRMVVEATNQAFIRFGGMPTAPDWTTYAILFAALVTSTIILIETTFTLLPKTLSAAARNPIFRFVENRLIDMPLLLPLTPIIMILLLWYWDNSALTLAPPVILLAIIPFGYLLRLAQAGPRDSGRHRGIIVRLHWFPLLPIALPLAAWWLGVLLFNSAKPLTLTDEAVTSAMMVAAFGLLPLGLFGLNPFAQNRLQRQTSQLDEAGSKPFVLPYALRSAMDRLAQMRPNDQRGLLAALFAAVVLSAFFTFDAFGSGNGSSPIEKFVGPIGMILLWCGGATGLFFLLSFFADSIKVPLVTFAVLWGVSLSILVWNDNHRVANTQAADTCDPATNLYACDPQKKNTEGIRLGGEFNFDLWLGNRRDRDEYDRYPVFIVATEGGGLRAAYFTASVLASIQDQCPKFSEHILGISSVSGGSLGAAVFSLSASSLDGLTKTLTCKSLDESTGRNQTGIDARGFRNMTRYRDIARDTFSSDLMTPTLSGSLFSDALQRIIPWELPAWDRALRLEAAFAESYQRATSQCPTCKALNMQTKFLDVTDPLPKPPEGWHAPPSLYFNLTEVETGAPAVLGSKRLAFYKGQALTTLNDKLIDIQYLTLGSAAVLSARFPYLTPAGKLSIATGWNRRFVDGGYFENSGTWSARAIADKVLRNVRGPFYSGRKIDIHLIVLRSSPLDKTAECLRMARSKMIDDPKDTGGGLKLDLFGNATPKPAESGHEYRVEIKTAEVQQCVEHLAGFETANEVLSPVRAVLNSRVARGELSQIELGAYAATAEALQATGDKTSVTVHLLSFTNTKNKELYEEDVPLTWILSKRARNYLDESVETIMSGTEAKKIVDLLSNTKTKPVTAAP